MTSVIFQGSSPFATALREARSARSLSIAEVAKSLLLSENQVVGLESDDFSAFYGASYAEKAARRYAAFLGVDAELAGAPRAAIDSRAPAETVPAATPLRSPIVVVRGNRLSSSPVVRWAAAGGLALVAVAITVKLTRAPTTHTLVARTHVAEPVSEAAAPPSDSSVAEPTVAAEPVVMPVATPTATIEPPRPVDSALTPVPDDREHRFFLVVTRDVKITAKDVYGTVLLTGLQRPDIGRRVVGEPPFEVEVSNEDAVEIYYRGQRIRPGTNTYDGIVASVVR